MKRLLLVLTLLVLFGALWGCPDRRYIPDPFHPQPRVQEGHSDFSYNANDVIHILKGAAPLVGPAPWFIFMLA